MKTMDPIDRQAAIDTLERKKDKNAKGDVGWFYNKIIQNDIDAIMQLPSIPSAQPEQKKGKWIPCKEYAREMLADKTVNILYDHYECSLCRCTLPNLLYNQDGEPFFKFCPNCGASMVRGEEDE